MNSLINGMPSAHLYTFQNLWDGLKNALLTEMY